MPDQPISSVPAGVRRPADALQAIVDRIERLAGTTPRLLLFGLVVSILGTFELSRVHPAPWSIQGGRAAGLRWTLDALNHGAPILTSRIPGQVQLAPAAPSDDQGAYVMVPWLAHALGWQDPVNLLRWMALVALGVAIALYPWLVRELTGSTLAGIASPFPLLIGLWLLPLGDFYWVSTWVILTLLPVLLLIDRRWPRRGLVLLLGLLVVASLASAIRSQAGLPAVIGAVLLVARRPWPRWARAGAVVLCAVAYLSVSAFGMAAVRAERAHQLNGRALAGQTGTGHPFWHAAYLGLGYLPNPWDIRFYDSVGYRDVLRVNPKAAYLGPTYSRILRDRYVKLVTSDPLFALKEYAAKLVVSIRAGALALLFLAIVGPYLLLVDRQRKRWRRDTLFIAPAAVIGLGSPLLATPDAVGLLLGWLAAILIAAIVAFGAVLGRLNFRGGWHAHVSPLLRGLRSRPLACGAMAIGVAAVLLCFIAAPSIQSDALRWAQSKPAPPVTQPPNAIP
jgi:hypothetical protein